jgi:hypothetical protein
MATNIKITALTDITSANMTYNDLVAVVDMNGTPETKKATVQLLGNLILAGAGGSSFVKAEIANLAATVTTAAQPNITSTGTLTSSAVTGNVVAGNLTANATVAGTAGVFTYVSGDGANLTNLPSGSNSAAIANGTSNVNIPAVDGNINTSVAGNANILIVTGTGANVTGTFNATGNAVVGNISATNLGNVSAVNLDGNVLNILHGDGSWSADATSYGNSNVVTLLNAFGSNTITTTGVITGIGSGLSAIAGANVTGSVPLATLAGTANAVAGANVSGAVALATSATTANAVALANVSGAGNIASINLDGNVSNVLRGDGTYTADAGGTYGDSNVVTLMGAFGVNAISTTGLITGDGGGLSNVSLATFAGTANAVAYANVSGLGSIATINIDGSAANVLYGNGVFAAASSPALTGDGYQLANLTGANVTGAIAFATTANAVAYANVSGTPTLGNISTINIDGSASTVLYGNGAFAAVASSPSTQIVNGTSNVTITGTDGNIDLQVGSANVGRIYTTGAAAPAFWAIAGNIEAVNDIETTGGTFKGIGSGLSAIAGANVSGTVALATTSGTVSTAAQPNITSTGTLTSLTVTGALGVTTGVITGDGGGISNVVAANISGTVNTAVLAQEVINSAQPNIGSVGTLSTLIVSGNVTGQSYVSATTALQTTPVITSALPAAATAGAGARSMVTDADAGSVFGAVLVGAGSLTLPVFSDGTDWRIG